MMKRLISAILSIIMVLGIMSVYTVPTYAEVTGTTNKYTYIRMAPYWTAEVVDNIASGVTISIIEREYTYLYIQYNKDGITKRGYMPMADTDKTGYSWCNHTQYNSGYNSTSSSAPVLYGPSSSTKTYTSCGSINADEGEVTNKPLLILRAEGNYYFVQYVTNTSNTGSSNVLFKRGWVLKSSITISQKNTLTSFNGVSASSTRQFYLKNVATGLYLDLESYSAGNVDGGNVHLWNFHGGWNQEWTILTATDANTGKVYAKIATNQGSQKRVLRITEKTAVINNNVDIYTQSSPSKEQEFLIEKTSDTANDYYYIKARCSGNFMVLGVSPGDCGAGGEIYLRYPENSNYNKWVIEPAAVSGTDYSYNNYGLSPNVTNGISASYNMTGINKTKTVNGTNVNFTQINQAALSSWNKTNSLITLSSNSSSLNTISWSNGTASDQVLGRLFGYTELDLDGSVDITMYYGSFEAAYDNDANISKAWQSVLAHEIGHTLGLGHILRSDGSVSSASHTLMAHNRNRLTIYTPTNYDIAALKKRCCTK